MIYMIDVDPPARYDGLCVGGPLHKKTLKRNSPYFRVDLMPPFPVLTARSSMKGSVMNVDVKTGEYRWRERDKVWVWVG